MINPRHPLQPIVFDSQNIIRFKKNSIIRFLLDWNEKYNKEREAGFTELGPAPDLNSLVDNFPDDDWIQFLQLIGYSVDGYLDVIGSAMERNRAKNARKRFLASIEE